jgi:peptidoglycan/LPS O-acetylase OafA/YrhL
MRLRWSFVLSLILYISGFFFKQDNMLLDFLFHYFFFFNIGMLLYDNIAIQARLGVKNSNWIFITSFFVLGLYANNLVGYRFSFLICCIATVWAIHQIIYGSIREFFLLKILRYLGKLSYTLYLFHIPLFVLLLFMLNKTGIYFDPYKHYYFLVALIVVLLSIPLYKLIEERSISFIQKFRAKKHDSGSVTFSQHSVSSEIVPRQVS